VSEFGLKKKQILRSKKEIQAIVDGRKQVKTFPILLLYSLQKNSGVDCKILFSVSKKKQKSAVKRNRIKRKLKESYRLNKLSLYNYCAENRVQLNVMCIQLTGEDYPFKAIEKKMISAISKLIEKETNERISQKN
jgi:ribonuclease P protein component